MDKPEIIVYELASVVYSLSYAKTPDLEREMIANISNLLRELQKAISVFDQIYVVEQGILLSIQEITVMIV
jgi:hypothetical protein